MWGNALTGFAGWVRSSAWCAAAALAGLLAASPAFAATTAPVARPPVLDRNAIAHEHFGADAPWFLDNIPYLDIDDAEIEQVYYYRWKLYRSHIREIGSQGTDVTEFLTDVPWARHPYTDLNDSSSFHIMEGRWLRNPSTVHSLVDHLYTGGGNDRHFSESITAATLAWTEVTGDPAPALRHLDAMQHIYNLWDDHFDRARNLYWVEPIADATEYTISSIDASGAGFTETPSKQDRDNGFLGGFAFRPSINAYQFANARAIADLARIAGQPAVAAEYNDRAVALSTAMLAQLWNPKLQHFTDVYQRSTAFVTAGDFIRGRELVGYLPWTFEVLPAQASKSGEVHLPPTPATAGVPATSDYTAAWHHLLQANELAGPRGLRTVEPTYARYLRQYRYDRDTGLRECQWNGPSWPFQTSQALTAMSNLLHDYKQPEVTATDYVHLLRQYTRQHYFKPAGAAGGQAPSATLDLQEDYDPDQGPGGGQPIVGLPRSHHYNHSTYNDLLVSGLVGLRPRLDDMLEVAPLLPAAGSAEKPIRYFALEGVRYHEHDLAIVYDADGTRYHLGAGLSLFSDGRRIAGPGPLGHTLVRLPAVGGTRKPALTPREHEAKVDLAVNVAERAPASFEQALPIASASSTASDATLYAAIDGRLWFFPEIANGWSPDPGDETAIADLPQGNGWYAVDLRQPHALGSIEVAFFSDGRLYQAPSGFRLQQLSPTGWTDVDGQQRSPATPVANGISTVTFPPVKTQQLRLVFPQAHARLRLVEWKVFAAAPDSQVRKAP